MAVCFLAVTTAMAQITVKGQVLSSTDGEGLIGAAVQEVGTTNGTVTDYNGNFSLKVKEGASLKISYVGYVAQTLAARANMVVNLKEDTKTLDDVVVIGYGVQKKSDVTGAISSVKEADLRNRSTTDAGAALQGKVAGVQILNMSGAPGETATIRVRGVSSNFADPTPLLIVDGAKVDNISYLDPSLIESIEVLKDAASAAIYGTEAGNGVILITTKKGRGDAGIPAITYSGKVTFQTLQKKAELMGAAEYIDYQKYIGRIDDALLNTYKYDGKDHNWFDAVFGTGISTQHNVTLQGANDKGHILASAGYVHNNGIVKGDEDVYNRLSIQLNADYQFTKWLKFTTNNSVERFDTRSVSQRSYGSLLNSVMSLDPLTPAYISDFNDLPQYAQSQINQYNAWIAGGKAGDAVAPVLTDPNHNGDYYGVSNYLQEATGNPLAQRDRTDAKNEGFSLRGSTSLDFNLFKGFVFTSRLGYRISKGNNHSYSVPYYLTPMASNVNYTLSASNRSGHQYQWENFANYNTTIAEKHNLGVMAGMAFEERYSDDLSVQGTGPDILKDYADNYRYISYMLPAGATNTWSATGSPSTIRNMSYFGRVSYNYDNKYYFQANFRADAYDSSTLSTKERWGYFPSFSAGWTISNEKFFQDNVNTDVFNFLKLRASWGHNGNIRYLIGKYAYSANVNINGQWYQNTPGSNPGNVSYGTALTEAANENLRWETHDQFDLGLNARFFNNRLTFDFDYYRKVTTDLLTPVKPVPESGISSSDINAGKILNSGVEFEVGWRDRIGDLKYGVDANLATVHNEVLEMPAVLRRLEGQQGGVSGLNNTIRTAFEEGQPVWYFRGYKYAGVNPETGAPRYYNKDGNIVDNVTPEDMQYIGKSTPDFTYGITINLEYKNFDFTLYGAGVSGCDIFSLLYSADRPTTNTLSTYWRNSWKQPGDNTKYADMNQVSNQWTYWSSSASMFNGSYFKFKQIQLGYTIPKSILAKTGFISGLRAYVSLDDFFTITSYPGCDPEACQTGSLQNVGYDCGTYPTTKKFVIGLNVSF